MLLRRAIPTDLAPTVRKRRTIALPMLAAALAGFASLLSFQPFGWWPVQVIVLAWLFYQVGMDTSVKRSLLVGWGFGFGWSVAGMHWLYAAITVYGGMPAPVAAIAIALLAVYMGVFSAFATGAATWLRQRWSLPVPAFLLLLLPACWGLSEWMRGWLFTGFPWASSGYAHNISPLAGFAPLVGVFGIGVTVAVCAACLVMLTQRARFAALGLLAAIMATGYGLTFIDWTRPHGAPISVRLLQGDVAQDEKFDAAHIGRALKLYDDMIREAPADLIATPETAIVLFPQQLPPGYLDGLARFARDTSSHLMYGIPLADSPTRYANSVAGIAPDGRSYRYDKQHLVPFGEFVPAGFRWFVDLMAIPLGDFTRGPEVQSAFAVKDQMVLPNVCYEDAFGEEIALQLRSSANPATMLLNVSNLAWYGKSVAIPQHLQISQMRSLETGRPMLRSTNNGATAVIDAKGRIAASLPTHARGTLAVTVQGMQGATPYIRFGNALFLLWCALAFGASWLMGRKYRLTLSQRAQK